MPFQKRTLLHVKQLPVSSQISSSREEKRPMLFYTDWLVMERNSSSSLTVLLASCKWTHLHELTPALSKPKTAGCIYSFPSAGTKEWLIWWEKTGETFLTSSSCMQTNLTSSLTASSEWGSLTEKRDEWSSDFWLIVTVYAIHTPVFVLCCNVLQYFYSNRPFRQLDSNGDLRWEKINSLDKGHIYKQVCIFRVYVFWFLWKVRNVACNHGLFTATARKYHILTCCILWVLMYWPVLLFCSSFSGKPIWFSQTDRLARFKGPLFWRPSL